jgi:hypothetical protein
MKASKEAASADSPSTELEDIDSGYGTLDPAETERDDPAAEDDDEDDSESGAFHRPVGVTDSDWRVYDVVRAATSEFEKKFRAMWA